MSISLHTDKSANNLVIMFIVIRYSFKFAEVKIQSGKMFHFLMVDGKKER